MLTLVSSFNYFPWTVVEKLPFISRGIIFSFACFFPYGSWEKPVLKLLMLKIDFVRLFPALKYSQKSIR
jgi:hypothetical protein